MKKFFALTLGLVLISASASAVRLYNKDSSSHKIIIKCSSTTHTSIGASSSRDIGSGPCTVTVKSSGASATASGSTDLVISSGGKISTK